MENQRGQYRIHHGKMELGADRKFVLASNNRHKISELKHMTEHLGIEILSMAEAGITDDIVEDGATFEENSAIKARHIFERYGYQAIADDSGLEVEALGGAPGVYSARYAGEEKSDSANNALLLKNMENRQNRNAKFVSVITVIYRNGNGNPVLSSFRGEVAGKIITEPRGTNGFGYDPLFELEDEFDRMKDGDTKHRTECSADCDAQCVMEYDAESDLERNPVCCAGRRTMAELEETEKNKISHRANAMHLFLDALF